MTARRVLAVLCFALSACVFLIRLHHPGPYAFPEQGNLRAALLAFALGIWFSRPRAWDFPLRRPLEIAILLLTPVVLFFALYATLAELEEVVVLETVDREGRAASLRLWVMDDEGAEWVNMPRAKASANGLHHRRVELLRDADWSCREATVFEDRAVVSRIDRLASEKYAVKRLAVRIGVFGKQASPDVVSVRLTPCEGARAALPRSVSSLQSIRTPRALRDGQLVGLLSARSVE